MDNERIALIEERIRSVWKEDANLVAACLAIVGFLKNYADKANHISYALLLSIARDAKVAVPDQALKAAQYLASPEFKLLEIKFEIIEDNDDVVLEALDAKTVKEFQETNRYIHPLTGLEDPELPSKLFIFFEASQEARRVFSRDSA